MLQQESEHIRLARLRVRSKKRFYRHFSAFLVITGFFFFMNMATDGMRDIWFIYPALVWGVPLGIHYLWVFGLPFTQAGTREWEQRELEREIQRRQPFLPPIKQSPLVDMDEHLELKTITKEKASPAGYEADDLV